MLFFAKFPLIYAFFPIFCSLCLIFVFFPHFGKNHGCIFLKIREWGGGKLRLNLRKDKDLVNNASILAIFSLKCAIFCKISLKYAIFCSLSLILVIFPHFLQISLHFLKNPYLSKSHFMRCF